MKFKILCIFTIVIMAFVNLTGQNVAYKSIPVNYSNTMKYNTVTKIDEFGDTSSYQLELQPLTVTVRELTIFCDVFELSNMRCFGTDIYGDVLIDSEWYVLHIKGDVLTIYFESYLVRYSWKRDYISI